MVDKGWKNMFIESKLRKEGKKKGVKVSKNLSKLIRKEMTEKELETLANKNVSDEEKSSTMNKISDRVKKDPDTPDTIKDEIVDIEKGFERQKEKKDK